ncbi:hypothetical protein BKA81DRAFT_150967 [Phyllosticta paracitricarpa]
MASWNLHSAQNVKNTGRLFPVVGSQHAFPPFRPLPPLASDQHYEVSRLKRDNPELKKVQKRTHNVDAGRIRTCAPEGNRFLVYRYNHSATAPNRWYYSLNVVLFIATTQCARKSLSW